MGRRVIFNIKLGVGIVVGRGGVWGWGLWGMGSGEARGLIYIFVRYFLYFFIIFIYSDWRRLGVDKRGDMWG